MHQPETLSPALVDRLVGLARDRGREYVGGVILEGVPRAKDSPGGYLHSLLEKGVNPAPASVEDARSLLEGTRALLDLEVGGEILPRDWTAVARRFRIQCPEADAMDRKAGLVERLVRFGGRMQRGDGLTRQAPASPARTAQNGGVLPKEARR